MIILYNDMWLFSHSRKWNQGWLIVRPLLGRLMLVLYGLEFPQKIIKKKRQLKDNLCLILIWMIMIKWGRVVRGKKFVLIVGSFWSLLLRYWLPVYLMTLDSKSLCMYFLEVVVCIYGYVIKEPGKCLIRLENRVLTI